MSEDVLLVLLQVLLLLVSDSLSLTLTRVSVPAYKLFDEEATLSCLYELGDDRLYSVTWYKDHEEFYRFVPRSEIKRHSYRLDGFNVELQSSTDQDVHLYNLTLKASGVYRCEVSAEAPSFTSVHGEGRMEIVSLPRENPAISGEQRNYKVGDVISLNCTSGRSYPAATLKWYVNDDQVRTDYEAVVQKNGLVTSVVGLRMEIRPDHFNLGVMTIKCEATISAERDTVREHSITRLLDERRAMYLVQGDSWHVTASILMTSFPVLLHVILT